ncbi:hypothetical protein L218DRAFT_950856 [Marasmius fiardii PR-910]|nr:hypothetical protein L218DRAFT_950856 [Marasmius fiardii PR-910]
MWENWNCDRTCAWASYPSLTGFAVVKLNGEGFPPLRPKNGQVATFAMFSDLSARYASRAGADNSVLVEPVSKTTSQTRDDRRRLGLPGLFIKLKNSTHRVAIGLARIRVEANALTVRGAPHRVRASTTNTPNGTAVDLVDRDMEGVTLESILAMDALA